MDMFWLGCLSVVVIIFMIAIVVGMVLIWKITKRVRSTEQTTDDIYRHCSDMSLRLDRRVDETYTELERKMEGNQCLMASFVDSRFDKFENRLKESK